MTPSRLLVVDDDQDFRDALVDTLIDDGYAVVAEATRDAALARFDAETFDAVLLDKRLLGSSGPEIGLDTLEEMLRRRPDSRVLMMTAFPEAEAIRRSLRNGAYDYLSKRDPMFVEFVKAKVRNAVAHARERRAIESAKEDREKRITELARTVKTETHKQKKGRLLEELLSSLFATIDGFYPSINARNDVEEIDVLVRNESPDAFWNKEGQYLLVECKNWQSKVGVEQLRSFLFKLQNRYDRARLGVLLSINGFTDTVERELLSVRSERALVILADGPMLDALVASVDRSALLKHWHERALLARGP
jgi:DNA-binding response OmpR family regulator